MDIASVVLGSMTSMERYTDQSLQNILLYLFVVWRAARLRFRHGAAGLEHRLEMQYYLALPFLMLIIARIGWPGPRPRRRRRRHSSVQPAPGLLRQL